MWQIGQGSKWGEEDDNVDDDNDEDDDDNDDDDDDDNVYDDNDVTLMLNGYVGGTLTWHCIVTKFYNLDQYKLRSYSYYAFLH